MSRNSSVDYKKLKEDFVSNLSGSSAAEINHVTAIAPVRIKDPGQPFSFDGAFLPRHARCCALPAVLCVHSH